MMILHAFQILMLWGLVFAAWAYAWMTSASSSTYDARVPWGVGVCVLAWAAGQLLVVLGSRVGLRLHRLDTTRHGLALLFAALAAAAMSHVGPHMSIRVIREEVPPIFLLIYPAFVAFVPLWLAAGARARRSADQLILLTVFTTAMTGAVFFMQASAAVGLGLLALTMQLVDSKQRAPRDAMLWIASILVGLLGLATLMGVNRLVAEPSWRWILAFSTLGLAIAWRRRDQRAWRDVLGASVTAAVLVALCGVVLTAYLAREVALEPALHSRLHLFRQHPNFLAPFFGFHAVLAVALAARRSFGSLLWLLAAVLLCASTWMTDSRTGMASTAIALMLLPGLPVLAALQRRIRLRWVFVAGLVLLAAGTFGLRELEARGRLSTVTSRVNRLQESMAFRADAWSNSVAIVREHPWRGIGPRTFLTVHDFKPESRFFNAPESPHPHDVFLYVAQSAGLPALLLFLLWMGVLVRRLWRRSTGPPEDVPRALLRGTLAAVIGLLLANLLDLGMSLDTVVPAPLFLITGLLVSDRLARRADSRRPARSLAWTAGLLSVFLLSAWWPLRAATHVTQAELLSYQAGQTEGDNDLLARARATLQTALRTDPAVPNAPALLARWSEDLPQGVNEAIRVLSTRIALAPETAEAHALLAQLYMRNSMFAEAADEFRLALADRQGSAQHKGNRANLIVCVARAGDRDGALELLVDALRVDAGVLHQIAWMAGSTPPHVLQVGASPHGENAQPPISLIEALQVLYDRLLADRQAGRSVGRTIWMGTFRAFREAGRDDLAAEMLDDLEANEPDVEPFTILAERGSLAYDAGDYALAAERFDQAYELEDRPFYKVRAAEARRAMGETVAAVEQGQEALNVWWEILDLPDAFRDSLRGEAENHIALGEPARAAAVLHRSLLFEDDLLERARLLHRIAELALEGRDLLACERTVSEAMVVLDAKPFPWSMLVEGDLQSLPGRLAQTLCDAWRAEGLAPSERLQRAWTLPAFFSSRSGSTLFRLAFYLENGQADRLLREADLALLGDPGHQPALWTRLVGLEGSGLHAELGSAMRTLVEDYATIASPERQFQTLVAAIKSRPQLESDPVMWRQLAMLTLLRGAYSDAIGFFDRARELLPDDPRQAADIAGWQALAAFLAGLPDEARKSLHEGLRLDPSNDMLRQRLEMAGE